MNRQYDPAGIVDLSELDELSIIESIDVQAQTTPVIAWTLISIISTELTVTAATVTAQCL